MYNGCGADNRIEKGTRGKRLALCVALLTVSLGLTGCQDSVPESGMTESVNAPDGKKVSDPVDSEALPESVEGDVFAAQTEGTVLPPPTSFLTKEEMAQADLWDSCDDSALAAVMRRAHAGEPVTIACIGGSITQGTISKGSSDELVENAACYAEILEKWWRERFPDTEITFINAGIGGTDSYLGVHRLREDVLVYHPDVVLVEFSVNDEDTSFYKKSYDNLVRNLLLREDAPAVMLLYMAQTNGASAQNSHVLVGYNYGLPMVSYANVIAEMMETGHYSARELSGDEVHPSALGHAVAGEILWNYLNAVYAARDSFEEPAPFEKVAVTNGVYENAEILGNDDITPDAFGSFAAGRASDLYPDGWISESGEGGIVFTAAFKRLGLLYLATVDGESGQYDVYVDGEAVMSIDADFSGGWGNAVTAKEVYSSKETAEHTVEIRKRDDSTGEKLNLLGLLVS